MHRPRLMLGLVLAALASLIALGCSSDEEPLTAEQASAIVTAGLLTGDDLPAGDWVVTEGVEDAELDLTDPDDLFANTEACREFEIAMQELIGDTADAEQALPLAEASRLFDNSNEAEIIARTVEASVSVPQDPDDVEAGFKAMRTVMTADALRPCFQAAFEESLGGDEEMGIAITTIDVTEPAKVKADGVAIAVDLEAIAFILPINMHLEMHFWPEGPAVGELMLMELNSETLQDAAPEIREAARTRLAEAVKANQ